MWWDNSVISSWCATKKKVTETSDNIFEGKNKVGSMEKKCTKLPLGEK